MADRTCRREGCNNPVAPRRQWYCSAECGAIANRKEQQRRYKIKTAGQEEKPRICLSCGKKFPSKGKYNRICKLCLGGEAFNSTMMPAKIGPGFRDTAGIDFR